MALTFAASDNGILPDRMIAALAEEKRIRTTLPFAPGQIQPASLDLRLGAIAYRVRASFLPGPVPPSRAASPSSSCTNSR